MPNSTCPICSSSEQNYLFSVLGARAERCEGCGLIRMPAGQQRTGARADDWAGHETEADAAERYAAHIIALGSSSPVLIVADDPHPLGPVLRAAGLEIIQCHPGRLHRQTGTFGCVVLLYCLEKLNDPVAVLEHAHDLLKDDGVLFLSTPALDSGLARFFGRSWIHWRSFNANYFTRPTLQLLLEKCSFRNIWFQPDRRLFALNHIAQRLRDRKFEIAAKIVYAIYSRLPVFIGKRPLRLATSGLLVMALKSPRRAGTTLSIIMPVYNERNTVATTLAAVIAKPLPGIAEREIVVVESNSSDGTKEIVRSFEGVAGVKIIYEPTPRGKGHAVRTGLSQARGDIILIQDADTEYDINDYDELLKPIIQWRQPFVLGSRHQGNWKMRTFTDNPSLAVLFNCGQLFFTWLMNTLYSQSMTDPFTMYKVFRRECIFGLAFECNRFDFDHELVIKLLLKGYRPHEVPVNYCSRSYSEGKKVTIIADPLLWIKANFKFRFLSPFQSIAAAYEGARQQQWRNAAARAQGSARPRKVSPVESFAPESVASESFAPAVDAASVRLTPGRSDAIPGVDILPELDAIMGVDILPELDASRGTPAPPAPATLIENDLGGSA